MIQTQLLSQQYIVPSLLTPQINFHLKQSKSQNLKLKLGDIHPVVPLFDLQLSPLEEIYIIMEITPACPSSKGESPDSLFKPYIIVGSSKGSPRNEKPSGAGPNCFFSITINKGMTSKVSRDLRAKGSSLSACYIVNMKNSQQVLHFLRYFFHSSILKNLLDDRLAFNSEG